jgi:GT2 family glycosyltransferase
MEQSEKVSPEVEKNCRMIPTKVFLQSRLRPGAQAARNKAAQETEADILLFIDDDVDPDPGLVEAHLENYRDPSIHAVAGFYLEPGETETSLAKDGIWWRPLTKVERYPASYTQRVDSALWPSCNGSIRREVFLKLGGFDENYRYTLLDDTDLAVRMQRAGYRCVHDPKARLFHRKAPTGGNRPAKPGDRVIASREKWYTWTYFFLVNYGALGVPELIWRIRRNIFRKAYFKNLYLLKISCLEALIGVIGGLQKALSGRKTIKL